VREYIKLAPANALTFSTGFIFFYWEHYNPKNGGNLHAMGEASRHQSAVNMYFGYKLEDLFIETPKYANLKEEVVESGFLSMGKFEEYVVLKAREHAKKRAVKGMKAAFKASDNCHYGIEKGAPITEEHIQSVILYTCFTLFCTAFSATFRSEYLGEPLKVVRERNKQYWWTSKLLRETVELFGTKVMDKKWKGTSFFCGMNRELAIPQYMIYLCGPTSTSSKQEVALRFGGERGIILRLSYKGYLGHGDNRLRFFDCKPLSNYKEENECLFFGGAWRIRIASVLVIRTARRYCKFSRIMFLLDVMVGGMQRRPKQVEVKPDDGVFLQHLFDCMIGIDNPDYIRYGHYIYDCFRAYTRKKQCLSIYSKLLREKYLPSFLRELILYNLTKANKKKSDNILRMQLLQIFPNLKMISIFPIHHPFSLKHFCTLYSKERLCKHGKIQRLQITLRGQRDSVMMMNLIDWLRSQYEEDIRDKIDSKYAPEYSVSFVAVDNMDRFVIEKNDQFQTSKSNEQTK